MSIIGDMVFNGTSMRPFQGQGTSSNLVVPSKVLIAQLVEQLALNQ